MTTIILSIYLISILLFVIFSAAGIYHLLRFGYSGDLTRAVIVIYLILAVGIITASAVMLLPRLIPGGGQ